MKSLDFNQMETITGGFPWASFAAGALCAVGLITAETGVGALLAIAGCGASFLSD